MSHSPRTRPSFKFWLETDEGFVLGPGVYSILKRVRETGTLKEAAESLDMSYRFAWGLVKKAEGKLGTPLLITHKGGRAGGGGTGLTEAGLQIIEDYTKIEGLINDLTEDRELVEKYTVINEIEGEVTGIESSDDRIELTIRIGEATEVDIPVSKKMLESLEVETGDHVCIELASLLRNLKIS